MLRMHMRHLDLLVQLPLLSLPVGRLLALLFPEGRSPSISFGGLVDPSYVDAIVLLLETAETFAAKPLGETSQADPARILEVYMVRVGNVCLVEPVGLHALLAVIEAEQIQEGRQKLLGVLSADSAEIRADGVNVAHVAFGLGMLLECIFVAVLFGTGRAIQPQATKAFELRRSGRPVDMLRGGWIASHVGRTGLIE